MGFKDFDYFGNLYRGLRKVEHYKAFAPYIRDFSKFFADPAIRQAIIENPSLGKSFYDIMKKWGDDVSLGGIRYENNFFDNLSRFTRKQLTPSVLAYNFTVTLKQMSSVFPAMQKAGKLGTLKELASLIKNPQKVIEQGMKDSVLLRYRFMSQERELIEAENLAKKFGKKTGYDNLIKWGYWATQSFDRCIATATFNAAKNRALSQGLSMEEAVFEGEKVVRYTQPMGGYTFLPHAFRGGELIRNYTFLKAHVNKLFNLQLEMLMRFSAGKDSVGKLLNNWLWLTLIPALTLFGVEKHRLPETPKEAVGALGKQMTLSLPGLSEFFGMMETGHFFFSTPLNQYFSDIAKVFSSKNLDKFVENTATAAGELLGLPVTGIKRIFQGRIFGGEKETQKGKRGTKRNAAAARRNVSNRRSDPSEINRLFMEQTANVH